MRRADDSDADAAFSQAGVAGRHGIGCRRGIFAAGAAGAAGKRGMECRRGIFAAGVAGAAGRRGMECRRGIFATGAAGAAGRRGMHPLGCRRGIFAAGAASGHGSDWVAASSQQEQCTRGFWHGDLGAQLETLARGASVSWKRFPISVSTTLIHGGLPRVCSSRRL